MQFAKQNKNKGKNRKVYTCQFQAVACPLRQNVGRAAPPSSRSPDAPHRPDG
jgi:hypothetical protein